METSEIDTESELRFDSSTMSPVMPDVASETGIDFPFLADLTLKTCYYDTECTSERISEKIKLPLGIAEALLQHLYKEKLLEIRERTALQGHRYSMLDRGWERARHLLGADGYAGPAPVSLDAYSAAVRWMEKNRKPANPELVAGSLSDLVLSDNTIETLGLVADSRRSLFLTGPAGSGKTSVAKALHAALEGEIWVPYAIEVDRQVIRIFDVHKHLPVTPPTHRYDKRWVRIKRPFVIVGGELTIEDMDLAYSSNIRFYEAPFQVKSNGGILIIDDFGRQRVNPHELLNRWIIPLENHLDYLTLHTGKKIEVPFEQLLIFATNLDPKDLVDEAFLRRIGYRLAFTAPSLRTYESILQRNISSRGLHYEPAMFEMLMERYQRENREMKSCDPRDLVERCLDICRYEHRPNALTIELLEKSWVNYFGTP